MMISAMESRKDKSLRGFELTWEVGRKRRQGTVLNRMIGVSLTGIIFGQILERH